MENWKPFKTNIGRLTDSILGGINSIVETVEEEIALYKETEEDMDKKRIKLVTEALAKANSKSPQ